MSGKLAQPLRIIFSIRDSPDEGKKAGNFGDQSGKCHRTNAPSGLALGCQRELDATGTRAHVAFNLGQPTGEMRTYSGIPSRPLMGVISVEFRKPRVHKNKVMCHQDTSN